MKVIYDIGKISDGYHTFDELYYQRAVLFACLCNDHLSWAWKSDKHSDGTMFDGMFIVGMTLPNGLEVTYHMENDYRDLFRNVKQVEFAPEWDGYTPEDVLDRLIAFFIDN